MLFVNLNFLVLISPQPIDPVFDGHLQRLFRGIRASFKQCRTRAVVSLGVLTVSNYNLFHVDSSWIFSWIFLIKLCQVKQNSKCKIVQKRTQFSYRSFGLRRDWRRVNEFLFPGHRPLLFALQNVLFFFSFLITLYAWISLE